MNKEECSRPKQRPSAVGGKVCLLLFILLPSSFCLSARDQYSIDWQTLAGGGGTSTGGLYSTTGTTGQPDVGTMSGGSFTVQGGFWGIIGAVQTPGAPLLTITRTMTNTVVVSWPSTATGFTLQTNTTLATPNCGSMTTAPSDDGTNKFIIVSPPGGNRFYRLSK